MAVSEKEPDNICKMNDHDKETEISQNRKPSRPAILHFSKHAIYIYIYIYILRASYTFTEFGHHV